MEKPIDPETIAKNSDFNLYAKVARLFENDGWDVDIRPHYTDAVTEKNLEMRVLASRRVGQRDTNSWSYQITSLSCRSLTQDIVFFAEDIRDNARFVTSNGRYRDPLFVRDGATKNPLLEYQWERSAKMFVAGGSDENRATLTAPVYIAVSGAVDGLILERSLWRCSGNFYHAAAVFQSSTNNGRAYQFFDSENLSQPVEEFCVDIEYSYYPRRDPQAHRENERFRVAITTEDTLNTLLQRLNRERRELEKMIEDKKTKEAEMYQRFMRPINKPSNKKISVVWQRNQLQLSPRAR